MELAAASDAKGQIIQNLQDAGCTADFIQRFLSLLEAHNTDEQKRLLAGHKKVLLEDVHKAQECIDCLDYLIYKLKL